MLRTAPSLELVKGQAFWVSVDLQVVPDPQLAASLMEHPFTQTCAISYLPAEILQDIFDLVLSTWLRPGDGNHLIDDLWLFHSGCASYREYWRIERVWRSLRSTCRQWYRLLEGHTVPLATTDNLKFYIYPRPIGSPAIQRLETSIKSRCWPICSKMCDSHMMRTEHTRAKQNRGVRKWITSNDCSNLGRLQIFIHKGDCDPQTDFSTFTPIYDAPLLRALSTYTFLYSPVNPPLPSLTHLHLRGTLDALPQLQLLRLKFLHLSIERTLDSRKDPQSTLFLFQSWSLPLLVTLRLSGEIVEEEGDLVRGLVLKFSQTMVNLVLDFCLLRPESSPIARTAPLSVVYPVLHLCQRLTVLGLPMPFLTHRTPIPSLPPLSSYTYPGNDSQPGTRSLSLLVLWTVTFNVDYKDRDKLDDNLTNSGMLGIFGRSEAGYTPWSLARVIIPYTWSELGTIWDEQHQIEVRNRHKTKKSPFYHPAEPAWVLFSHFIRKNLEIFDVEGVELHDEKDGGMAIFKPFIPDPVGEGLHPPKTRRRRSLLRFPIRF